MRATTRGEEWSDEDIWNLRRLWDEGHSTAEIGRRLGRTKNSIVGKAHRLDLPERPSPIVRDYPNTAAAKKQAIATAKAIAKGPTIPPLPSLEPVVVEHPILLAPVVVKRVAVTPAPFVPRPMLVDFRASTPRPKPTPPPPQTGPVIECQWPLNEGDLARGVKWLFCEAPSAPSRVYCPLHCQAAFVRVRVRREDAAGMVA